MKWLLIILFFAFSAPGKAQLISRVSTDRDSLVIGDAITLYHELFSSQAIDIARLDYTVYDSVPLLKPANSTDSLPDFAQLEWMGPDESVRNEVRLQSTSSGYMYRDTLQLRVWDTGLLELPHPNLSVPDSIRIQYTEKPLLLSKLPEGVINTDSTTVILPIKDILREEKKLSDYLWIVYTLLALAALFLLFRLLSRKKTATPTPELTPVYLPAHLVALDKLQALDNLQLWQKGEIKEFQSRLTYIIREYIEGRFGIPALEMTSDEIAKRLDSTGLSPKLISDMKEILQIADLIKFAKAQPPGDIHQRFLEQARRFIFDTRQVMSPEEETQLRKEYETYLSKLAKLNGSGNDS